MEDSSDDEQQDMLVFDRTLLQNLTNTIQQQMEFTDSGTDGEIHHLCRSIIELGGAQDSCLNTLRSVNINAVEWADRFEEC